MSELSKVKYKLEDIDEEMLLLSSSITQSRSIERRSAVSGGIDIITGFCVTSGVLRYEITVLSGTDVTCVLKLNGDIIVPTCDMLASGVVQVKSKKMNNIELVITGTGLSMARLKLSGVGLKLI